MWLVGETSEAIRGSKLPSNRQVLSRFYFLHYYEFQTIRESATTTARELLVVWGKARIPVRQEYHVVSKVKEIFSEWQSLLKNKNRFTATENSKRDVFLEKLDELFDVAHTEALNLIKIQEDHDFLIAQREKGRRGCLGPVDKKLLKLEERRMERHVKAEARKIKEDSRVSQVSNQPENDVDTSDSCDIWDNDPVHPLCISTPRPKRQKTSIRPNGIISPELAAALDRTNVSDRNATYILAATAQTLGHNPNTLAINKESIRRARRTHRETAADGIKAAFTVTAPLTVHWDGKMLPALTGKATVERIAVLVTGEDIVKLLGIPKVPNGTGIAQATAVFDMIQEWEITDDVKFMSFDTTASNTGRKAGACVILQEKLRKELLSLPCRHHIMELIVSKVFANVMPPSTGPDIKLFQRFSAEWNNLNHQNYSSGMADNIVEAELLSHKTSLIEFYTRQLTEVHSRDDYKELLTLALVFLGAQQGAVRFNSPGAFHRARWMAKMIYGLKIFLFRDQFHVTAKELAGLRQFNVFIIQLYLKAWYTCQIPATAPRHDLQLIKDLGQYKRVNPAVAKVAMESILSHLWYLSEPMIGLGFFDAEVPPDQLREMVLALQKRGSVDCPVRLKLKEEEVAQKQLQDFVTSNTTKLFSALGINMDFLQQDPHTWRTNANYKAGKQRVASLKVVNDVAERGVALIQEFNSTLSNQEEQKQFVLQVVERHRKEYPNANKATVTKTTQNL